MSGGFITTGSGSVTSQDTFDAPNSWTVILDNIDSATPSNVQAIAYCAPSNQAAAPRAAQRARTRAAIEAALAGRSG